jgi:hypothetical protein
VTVFCIPQRAKATAPRPCYQDRTKRIFVILPPLPKKPILRLNRHRYYRRFPRYFPIIESIFSVTSVALALSDLRYNNPVTYKAHSLNPRLNTIPDRRRNRAILRDIKAFLVFLE